MPDNPRIAAIQMTCRLGDELFDLALIRDQLLQEPILRGFRPEFYRFRND
ncbi:MAG: hypothetical protein MAG451_01087 [Anaerolineales bacterium]|nr:hypothetical protein [Anaerolineales bacterium]